MAPFLEAVVVRKNDEIAPDISCVLLEAPRVAQCLEPGQFVHLLLPTFDAHILRRPFSVFATDAAGGLIEIVYQRLGEGTRFLAELQRGASLDLIGPLGQGWRAGANTRNALLVAGGIGIAPLNMLAAQLLTSARVCLITGAQSAERIVSLRLPSSVASATTKTGESRLTVITTTDDGSTGIKGLVTDVTGELLAQQDFDYLATCGPEPMQRIVAAHALAAGVTCEVSLERRMACGIGACLSCAVLTRDGTRRACVDGPVFNAEEVLW
ncbi:MAG: dihydroorotate dehydrogenase electron transfer subunit [Coriobacteriales bacterium]|jgi:dihydroorotate dehydrogenase electron transfer subunit|nr:dihydroorotate dehydrogenase electron transfer subunit [Coriobacteriales bacterium]